MLYRRYGALGFDLVKSYFWLTVSGENGFAAGFAKRSELVALGVMRQEEIVQAKKLMVEYHKYHPPSVPTPNLGTTLLSPLTPTTNAAR